MKPKKVLFVCWGNIFRSPVAKIFLDREINKRKLNSRLECDSAGIQGSANIPFPKFINFTFYKKEFEAARPTLEKFNLDLSKHRSKPISTKLISQADIILVMDRQILDSPKTGILFQFPQAKDKTYLLSELTENNHDISDPDGMTIANKYVTITEEMQMFVTEGFENLLKILNIEKYG